MKRPYLLIAGALFALGAAGCSTAESESAPPAESSTRVEVSASDREWAEVAAAKVCSDQARAEFPNLTPAFKGWKITADLPAHFYNAPAWRASGTMETPGGDRVVLCDVYRDGEQYRAKLVR